MLADTVGFIRDLPHDLVAAFRSTLSEARDADLLLHVVDAADPLRDEHIASVDAVLAEIGADAIPQLMVWNKIDLLPAAEPRIERIDAGGRWRAWVSAARGLGLDGLREAIDHHFASERVHRWADPAGCGRALACTAVTRPARWPRNAMARTAWRWRSMRREAWSNRCSACPTATANSCAWPWNRSAHDHAWALQERLQPRPEAPPDRG